MSADNTTPRKRFVLAVLIRVYLCSSVALISSCGRYANFTLPPTPGGDTSLVFRFLPEPAPVIPRGEFKDALNPSVAISARALAPIPINLYSVFDGRTWHTAEAVNDKPQGIVLSP